MLYRVVCLMCGFEDNYLLEIDECQRCGSKMISTEEVKISDKYKMAVADDICASCCRKYKCTDDDGEECPVMTYVYNVGGTKN
jgi:hypothetical protein